MKKNNPVIVWFRQDLRMDDHPALACAAEYRVPILPVFILPDLRTSEWGSAGQWWLSLSLKAFQKELQKHGLKLIFRRGDPRKVFDKLIRETKAQDVFWNKSYEPFRRRTEESLERHLTQKGITVKTFNGSLLFDPEKIFNQQKMPFKVFTPFWNHCLSAQSVPSPLTIPSLLLAPKKWPRSERPDVLDLFVKKSWTEKMEPFWEPGPQGASKAWKKFLGQKLAGYSKDRDKPFMEGTSKLSPHLHLGEISIRRIGHDLREHLHRYRQKGLLREGEAFLRQLIWREFAHYLLYHFPFMAEQPLRKEFSDFSWHRNKTALKQWQQGRTGFPIVDAGMRELWGTGWMHNRVRMIAASFLVKDLLQPWQEGANWFWDTLVDADRANNAFGWQWVAGCGADAAPYFRIFNPVLQGEKFDPEGEYVRRWVPELLKLPSCWIHKPWLAPQEVLLKAGVKLGKDYPYPIVDHGMARKRALIAYDRLKH